MNFNKSNNPLLKDKALARVETLERRTGGPILDSESATMTVSGAVNRTLVLVMITMVTFLFSFVMPNTLFLYGGMIGGFIIYLVTSFKPHLSPITSPMYAIAEGLFTGTISYMYASLFDGIIFQAASLTICVLLTMMLIYRSGLIKVTDRLRMIISTAVSAIMIVYLIALVGHFVGFEVPYLHQSGPIGIGISLFIIGVASFKLLVDFDNFEKGEQASMPKYMEWYFGMSLLFTIVWLYVEFLSLIARLSQE